MVTENFKIIGMTVLILVAMGIIISMVFLKLIVPICDSIGTFFARRMKSKFWLYILELLFFVIMGTFIYFGINLVLFTDQQPELFMVYFFIYIISILIETSIYRQYREINKLKKTVGITGWLIHRRIWKSYIAKRFILFVEQLAHTFYLIIPVYLSLIFMSVLKWEESHYFYSLLFLPVYSNVWVYIRPIWKKYFFKLSFNSYEEMFMRRFMIYFLIIVYAFFEVYEKFNQYLYEFGDLTFEYLFIYAAVVLYIALDRLLKEIVSDLDKFRKENSSKQLRAALPNNVFTYRGTSPDSRQMRNQRSKFRRHIYSSNHGRGRRDRASRTPLGSLR